MRLYMVYIKTYIHILYGKCVTQRIQNKRNKQTYIFIIVLEQHYRNLAVNEIFNSRIHSNLFCSFLLILFRSIRKKKLNKKKQLNIYNIYKVYVYILHITIKIQNKKKIVIQNELRSMFTMDFIIVVIVH